MPLYFERIGQESQLRLKRESFRIGKDDVGLEFIQIRVNEKVKNHPGSVADAQHKQSGRYSISGDSENRPVFAF